MTIKEFKFNENSDINKIIKNSEELFVKPIGKSKFVGLRLYYIDEDESMMESVSLLSKGFDPEEF